MANNTDLALVAKGAQKRKQTDRLVIGLLDDQSAVVGMQGDNEVFRINTAFMQPKSDGLKSTVKSTTHTLLTQLLQPTT